MAQYCCFANSIVNAETAVLERVFYHKEGERFARPYIPSFGTIATILSPFLSMFQNGLTTTVPTPLSVYPELNYRGRKLKLYQKARDVVRGRTIWPGIADIKAFVKHEKILQKGSKRLVPRLIQPRSPEYNVLVGRYIRQLEHRIYDRIESVWGGPTVMKGRNCVQQGRCFKAAWSSFSDPVAIMLDAVRFDQHVSAPMLQWEHNVYLSFFQGHFKRELAKLLDLQLHNRGRIVCADGRLSYAIDGCRASGDMNTSMGNVIIMCGAIYSYRVSLGVKMRLMNNGDDCCLIVERSDVQRVAEGLPNFFGNLGFLIDIEGQSDVLERISFCQTNPVFDGQDWVMVRDPKTCISKDVTILRNWSALEYSAFFHQLGVCGSCAYGNLPIFKSFYSCLRRSDISQCSSGMLEHVNSALGDSGLWRLATDTHREGPITVAARVSFAIAFGINPDIQRYWESYYDRMSVGDAQLCAPSSIPLHL